MESNPTSLALHSSPLNPPLTVYLIISIWFSLQPNLDIRLGFSLPSREPDAPHKAARANPFGVYVCMGARWRGENL